MAQNSGGGSGRATSERGGAKAPPLLFGADPRMACCRRSCDVLRPSVIGAPGHLLTDSARHATLCSSVLDLAGTTDRIYPGA